MSESKRSNRRKKPKRLWLKISLDIILVLTLGVGVYGLSIYNDAKQTVNEKIHQKTPSIDSAIGKKKISDQEPVGKIISQTIVYNTTIMH